MAIEDTHSIEDPRTILKRYDLRPKRSWGQNFLISPRAINKIASECVDSPDRLVIEIGAGVGTLTRALLQRGARVVAIERDRDMCRVLRSELLSYPNFELQEADAVRFDYASRLVNRQGVIAGNLPYQLTGRLLRALIDNHEHLARGVIMIQREVAKRILAEVGSKERGALSVLIQVRFKVKNELTLRPTAFFPPPKVVSNVVSLTPPKESLFRDRSHEKWFDRVVKASFSGRLKTIRNSLVMGKLGSAEEVESLLRRAGIDPAIRPIHLPVTDYLRLADAMGAMNRAPTCAGHGAQRHDRRLERSLYRKRRGNP